MFAHLPISLFFFDTIRHLQLKHNIWQNTMIWQKTCIDRLTDYVSELAEKRSVSGEICTSDHTQRFHLTWYAVFFFF